ncbi:uncharacterized protein LOC123500015 isoform X2 [Portunus trituberculatus]|uniref:uncharacterized protein LOC123500015 isoform X2 n=1 Tax=Portunus trituberculatus TaxID=210409 RepID=UPI001E1CD712|nr:uncharacterized protein LOC123500015 isoform X2 [Portunus trituberculatus]
MNKKEWKPKMAANLHFQLNQGTRRFLFSGISSDFESSLCQKIERLQGRVVFPTTNMFSSLCTHVVAQEFSPTEKVLGALAGGKWLLTVNYITDSFEKGYWLHEEDYEYTTFNKVPAYHRCNRELKNKGLYEGWKVLVVMDSSKTTRTFKRILAAGGAEIASKEDTTDVDFVITTKDVVKYAQTLVSCFVPLVDVTYIKETILFRSDPADLKRRNLRDLEIVCISDATSSNHSKPDGKTQEGYCASTRKPANETTPSKRKQNCIKTKQTTITQFLESTVKEPSLKNNTSKEKGRESASQGKNLPIATTAASFTHCDSVPRPPPMQGAKDTLKITKTRRMQESETMQDVEDEPQTTELRRVQQTEPMQDVEDEPQTKSINVMKLKHSPRKSKKMEHWLTNHVLTKESEAVQLTSSMCTTVLSPEIKRKVSCESRSAFFPELREQGVPSFTMTKSQAKKQFLNFIRSRECLNEVCCTDLCLIPIENTESKSYMRETITQQDLVTQNEPREMTRMEMNAYTSFVSPELRYQELYIHGLDLLLNQVSCWLYPPPAIMGHLLRDMILETQSRIVHSRALRVAYRVLSLHRPTTTKMRKYYLSILEKAMQKASEDYTAWAFIQRVIHFALEDDDETASDSDTHSKDGIDEAKKALSLLEFLITLITEDIKNSPYGKAVQELLTWDIFWGPSKAYNVVPPPVKKLIQLWMSHETSFVLRMALSRLVTLVLELLWKLSGHPLVPVFALPDTLAAMEIEIQVCCKGVSFEKRVEMVRSLPNPWAQCIVSFIILQEALQCPRRLTLASLVDLFNSTSNNMNSATCNAEFAQEGCISRISPTKEDQQNYHRELLVTLANCYLEVAGHRYFHNSITESVRKKLQRVKPENKTDKDNDGQAVDTESKGTQKQYLTLTENESLESASDLEQNAIVDMYESIRRDKEVSKKLQLQNSGPLKEVDVELLFRTLCLY